MGIMLSGSKPRGGLSDPAEIVGPRYLHLWAGMYFLAKEKQRFVELYPKSRFAGAWRLKMAKRMAASSGDRISAIERLDVLVGLTQFFGPQGYCINRIEFEQLEETTGNAGTVRNYEVFVEVS